jgi:hypothetical protein
MITKKLLKIPGIEAYNIAHVKYGVVRVTVAIAKKKGKSWTAYSCNYNTGHHGRDAVSKRDIEDVQQLGQQISAAAAARAFADDGLWQLLNGQLGEYHCDFVQRSQWND